MSTTPADLFVHPRDAGLTASLTAAITAERTLTGVRLTYLIRGAVTDIVWPPPAAEPGRAEGLWRHTCFELFVAVPGNNGYYEWNVSPAGGWACYRFGGYRERLADPEGVRPPVIELRHGDDAVQADVEVDFDGLSRIGRFGPLDFAVTCVLEGADGALAHFALAHPEAVPDFHDRRGFALTLASIAVPVKREPRRRPPLPGEML